MDALRISPKYTSRDWKALDRDNADAWAKAAEIVRDRLEGRFLQFATICLSHEYSGFVVLSIDSLLAEALQQFKKGIIDGHGKSKKLVKCFLEGKRFQPDFDVKAREAFYTDIRCGLLHQAEAKEMWLIRRNQAALLQKVKGGQGYIIDVKRFHTAVQDSLNDYLKLISNPDSTSLRNNLWEKMNHICNVREVRGVLYETVDDSETKKSAI
jgi:hypothetical protein